MPEYRVQSKEQLRANLFQLPLPNVVGNSNDQSLVFKFQGHRVNTERIANGVFPGSETGCFGYFRRRPGRRQDRRQSCYQAFHLKLTSPSVSKFSDFNLESQLEIENINRFASVAENCLTRQADLDGNRRTVVFSCASSVFFVTQNLNSGRRDANR